MPVGVDVHSQTPLKIASVKRDTKMTEKTWKDEKSIQSLQCNLFGYNNKSKPTEVSQKSRMKIDKPTFYNWILFKNED